MDGAAGAGIHLRGVQRRIAHRSSSGRRRLRRPTSAPTGFDLTLTASNANPVVDSTVVITADGDAERAAGCRTARPSSSRPTAASFSGDRDRHVDSSARPPTACATVELRSTRRRHGPRHGHGQQRQPHGRRDLPGSVRPSRRRLPPRRASPSVTPTIGTSGGRPAHPHHRQELQGSGARAVRRRRRRCRSRRSSFRRPRRRSKCSPRA